MNSKSFLFALCGMFLLTCRLPVGAQQGGGSGTSGIYNFRFSLIALTPDQVDGRSISEGGDYTIPGVRYETGGIPRDLPPIPYQSRSSSYLYRGNDPLTFFREEVNPNGGDSIRKVLAQITPDRDWRSVLILATPSLPGGPEGFRAEAIADDPRAFPENSILLVNRSRAALAIRLEGTQQTVPAGGQLGLPLRLDQAQMLPLQLLTPAGAQWSEAYSTSVPFRPGQRLLLVVQGNAAGQLKLPPLLLFDTPARTRFDSFDPSKQAPAASQ